MSFIIVKTTKLTIEKGSIFWQCLNLPIKAVPIEAFVDGGCGAAATLDPNEEVEWFEQGDPCSESELVALLTLTIDTACVSGMEGSRL